jgi:hypothetical protein
MRKTLLALTSICLIWASAAAQQKRNATIARDLDVGTWPALEPFNAGCDSIGWPIPSNLRVLVSILNDDAGFIMGNNEYGDIGKGNFFDMSGSSATFLNRMILGMGYANGAGGGNLTKPVVFRVFDGTTNAPGAELGRFETTLGALRTINFSFVSVPFTPAIPLPASKKIFLTATFPDVEWVGSNAAENDSLVFRHSGFNEPAVNLGWEQWANGSWNPFTTPSPAGWGARIVMHTYPLVSQSADGCVLPVTFGMLTATPRTGSVDVSWTTYTETNNLYFEVERSTDARQFTPIGRVDSKSKSGDFQGVLNYTFTDAHPSAGTNFYRIRQVDRDGSSSYSDIAKAVVSTTVANHPVAAYYPNPAGSRMVVQLKEGNRAVESVRFSDASGRVSSQYKPAVAPDGQMVLPTGGLRQGMHLLTITFSGGEQTTLKVVKE